MSKYNAGKFNISMINYGWLRLYHENVEITTIHNTELSDLIYILNRAKNEALANANEKERLLIG